MKERKRLIKLSQKGGGQLYPLEVSDSNSEKNIHEGLSQDMRAVEWSHLCSREAPIHLCPKAFP